MNRIGRRAVICMLLIVALAIIHLEFIGPLNLLATSDHVM